MQIRCRGKIFVVHITLSESLVIIIFQLLSNTFTHIFMFRCIMYFIARGKIRLSYEVCNTQFWAVCIHFILSLVGFPESIDKLLQKHSVLSMPFLIISHMAHDQPRWVTFLNNSRVLYWRTRRN